MVEPFIDREGVAVVEQLAVFRILRALKMVGVAYSAVDSAH